MVLLSNVKLVELEVRTDTMKTFVLLARDEVSRGMVKMVDIKLSSMVEGEALPLAGAPVKEGLGVLALETTQLFFKKLNKTVMTVLNDSVLRFDIGRMAHVKRGL